MMTGWLLMSASSVTYRNTGRIAILVAVVALIVAAIVSLPVQDYSVSLLTWIEGLGFTGYIVFFALYVLFTVLFLPGFIFTLGGGALFGLGTGFVVVSLGSTVGACAAFLIGRFLARDMVARRVAGSPRFSAIDSAVGRQGWKIVFLTRLSPVFPFNLINYAYGLTRIPFLHYALATWIGMMPGTLVYVYLGSLAGDVARAAVGDRPDASGLETATQVVGLMATVAVTWYITRIARRALREALPEDERASGEAAK
ncbi:TVP38/TMEM64 family protein [Fodinicurvata sp. EGI_FJ10296]|uniref:TVP38/TMEM64 family protein n=1 Tax=Fodinicurvata sp. EGI_FJ10296 TaxID=3231908 RepID=UPI003455F8F7